MPLKAASPNDVRGVAGVNATLYDHPTLPKASVGLIRELPADDAVSWVNSVDRAAFDGGEILRVLREEATGVQGAPPSRQDLHILSRHH